MVISPGTVPQVASLYVGDLHRDVSEGLLYSFFTKALCDGIVSIRVCRDSITGESRRYAYINFNSKGQAEHALKILNHSYLCGKPIRIMWKQKNPFHRKAGIGNLFVKNLDDFVDGRMLEDLFAVHGTITSCKVVMDEEGKSKGYGFVHFRTEESALAAILALNGKILPSGKKCMYVGKFIRKSVRQSMPSETGTKEETSKNVILCVNNIDPSIDDKELLKMFKVHGNVLSANVMHNSKMGSRGFGFVQFSDAEEANRARENMNGNLAKGRLLSVTDAQTEQQQLHFLQPGLACPIFPCFSPEGYVCYPDQKMLYQFGQWLEYPEAAKPVVENGANSPAAAMAETASSKSKSDGFSEEDKPADDGKNDLICTEE